MSNKFTEEQYQSILTIAGKNEEGKKHVFGNQQPVFDYLGLIDKQESYNIAILFIIDESREWAHDKFVEKEKKYYWKLKGNWEFALVSTRALVNLSLHNKSALTESEIKEWGYNPEMFDKEEV